MSSRHLNHRQGMCSGGVIPEISVAVLHRKELTTTFQQNPDKRCLGITRRVVDRKTALEKAHNPLKPFSWEKRGLTKPPGREFTLQQATPDAEQQRDPQRHVCTTDRARGRRSRLGSVRTSRLPSQENEFFRWHSSRLSSAVRGIATET